MDSVYHVSNFLQRMTLRTFADWRVTGAENVPPMGPLVVVANHMSNVDSSLLGVSISRRLNFLAKDDVFRAGGPIGKWFLTNYGAFPIDRAGADARAFRWVLRMLQRDAALVIFPEGTRSRTASMNKAKPGVASLILKSGGAGAAGGHYGYGGTASLSEGGQPNGKAAGEHRSAVFSAEHRRASEPGDSGVVDHGCDVEGARLIA